jgi:ketosteroid isomerase-like protein
MARSFADYRFEVQRIVDCGGDHVRSSGSRWQGRRERCAEVRSLNSRYSPLVRDGMIVRLREFYEERDALEAAGLRE